MSVFVILLALLVVVGTLLYLITAAFRDATAGGIRGLAATIMPILVVTALARYRPHSLRSAIEYMEGMPTLSLVGISVVAGALTALLVGWLKPANPLPELVCSSLLVWVTAVVFTVPHGKQGFVYSLWFLIGFFVFLMLFLSKLIPAPPGSRAGAAGAGRQTGGTG